MSGAAIARVRRPRAGRHHILLATAAVVLVAAGWAVARPPSVSDRTRVADTPEMPPAGSDATGPARLGRSVGRPRSLVTAARRSRPERRDQPIDAVDLEEIRLGPGRWRPRVAAPGVGVPVEAIVRDLRAATGGDDPGPLEVTVLTRVHPELPWTRIPMRPLGTDGQRFQAVIPCAPCHARPEYRFEAAVAGDTPAGASMTVRWPAEADEPSRYDVGYERERHAGGGAVLRAAPASHATVGRAFTPPAEAWRSPVWSIAGSVDPIVTARWIAFDGDGSDGPARCVLAVRGGPVAAWTVIRVDPRPPVDAGTPWVDISEAVRRHLPAADAVQVAIWSEGGGAVGGGGGRLLRPRLVEIRCTPPAGPDVDGDGLVGLADLLLVFEAFGPCDSPRECPADVSGDGRVDLADVLLVVAAWGTDGAA